MNHEFDLAVYCQLRAEVEKRALAYTYISVIATVLSFIATAFGFYMFWLGIPFPMIGLYILFLPLIFAGLLFTFQANQATMIAAARYAQRLAKKFDKVEDWEDYLATCKQQMRLTTLLGGVAVLLPMLAPIALVIAVPAVLSGDISRAMWVIDMLVLLLGLINFRYFVLDRNRADDTAH